MKVCYDHLLSSVPNHTNEAEPKMYYKADRAKTKIKEVLEEAWNSDS